MGLDNEIKRLGTRTLPVALRNAARLAGIAAEEITPYCFRREFITAIARSISRDVAQGLAGYRVERLSSSWESYDFGYGDLDLAHLRLDEPDMTSAGNDLRRMLTPPFHDRKP
jgi:hypothetical protein